MTAFTKKQVEYLNNATHRWNVKHGATRSGKTYLDYYVIPKRIRRVAGLDGLVMIIGNTRETIRKNIILPLQKIWGCQLVGDIRTSDNSVMLFGERCYILGADKVSQVDKLRGQSIKYCYGDEVVSWAPEVFEMLKSRLDKAYSRFDGTCNPESPNHWFKQFIDGEADVYAQNYTIYDNPFLPEEVRKSMETEYKGTVYYDRYILGQWVNAEGLIYPMFDDTMIFDKASEKLNSYYISIDYGTLNPCSMGLWGIDNKTKTAYRLREFYYDGRKRRKQLTDREYYIHLDKLAGDLPIECVVVDPSAASFITEIRQRGKFDVRKANNDVASGIRCAGSFIGNGQIKVNKSCEGFLAEVKAYLWDADSVTDKPIKDNDHAMDDMRYFCYTILNKEFY